ELTRKPPWNYKRASMAGVGGNGYQLFRARQEGHVAAVNAAAAAFAGNPRLLVVGHKRARSLHFGAVPEGAKVLVQAVAEAVVHRIAAGREAAVPIEARHGPKRVALFRLNRVAVLDHRLLPRLAHDEGQPVHSQPAGELLNLLHLVAVVRKDDVLQLDEGELALLALAFRHDGFDAA